MYAPVLLHIKCPPAKITAAKKENPGFCVAYEHFL